MKTKGICGVFALNLHPFHHEFAESHMEWHGDILSSVP
jgi:hypothetical protein